MLRRVASSSLRRASRNTSKTCCNATSYPLYQQRLNVPTVEPQWCSIQTAQFSTDVPAKPLQMTETQFVELADKTLHDIQSWLDGIEEMLDDSDIMYTQGVLKIDLGEHGTWVLNRQVPNRQIWWSSPISGPRRYEYHAEGRQWVNTRDSSELTELLHTEILNATGIEIYK
ncbi:hypothetical protein CCR75_001602 [Bremia lactucae]|uniref:ferroxidase n=1 Tax=Bremia lactucae TaxID=4779 RepID=A0A976ICM3_BRELC|nr:hypothetical protein CCR75_001602 [Bremia lactucae]